MIVDVLMAFVMAVLLNMVSFENNLLKQIVIFGCCLTSISVYFVNGCKINFIGEMDFAIWIMFVIIFNIAFSFVARKFNWFDE